MKKNIEKGKKMNKESVKGTVSAEYLMKSLKDNSKSAQKLKDYLAKESIVVESTLTERITL